MLILTLLIFQSFVVTLIGFCNLRLMCHKNGGFVLAYDIPSHSYKVGANVQILAFRHIIKNEKIAHII